MGTFWWTDLSPLESRRQESALECCAGGSSYILIKLPGLLFSALEASSRLVSWKDESACCSEYSPYALLNCWDVLFCSLESFRLSSATGPWVFLILIGVPK